MSDTKIGHITTRDGKRHAVYGCSEGLYVIHKGNRFYIKRFKR